MGVRVSACCTHTLGPSLWVGVLFRDPGKSRAVHLEKNAGASHHNLRLWDFVEAVWGLFKILGTWGQALKPPSTFSLSQVPLNPPWAR